MTRSVRLCFLYNSVDVIDGGNPLISEINDFVYDIDTIHLI